MKETDNKWRIGEKEKEEECQNRSWVGRRNELDLKGWEMDKGWGATRSYVINLLHVSGIDQTPPCREFTSFPLRMTDTVIIRKTCSADCDHVCLCTCICVCEIYRVEGKAINRERWKLPFLFFSFLPPFNDWNGIIQIWFYFVFCFALSGTSSVVGDKTQTHTHSKQILLNLSPQACFWHLQNTFLISSFTEETHINVVWKVVAMPCTSNRGGACEYTPWDSLVFLWPMSFHQGVKRRLCVRLLPLKSDLLPFWLQRPTSSVLQPLNALPLTRMHKHTHKDTHQLGYPLFLAENTDSAPLAHWPTYGWMAVAHGLIGGVCVCIMR